MAFILFLPCIWDACRSIVMIWSAPAFDNIFATNFAVIGALDWNAREDKRLAQQETIGND